MSPIESLSPQQRHILQLVGSGLTDQQIGDRLALSPYTVKGHLQEAYRRLGVAGPGNQRVRACRLLWEAEGRARDRAAVDRLGLLGAALTTERGGE
jgi:two-component system, NarL family, response regulator DevR